MTTNSGEGTIAPSNSQSVRILIVASHPAQYAIAAYRQYMADPRSELTVAFCVVPEAGRQYDAGFGVEVSWGIPMLEGYRLIAMKNRSRSPSPATVLGMINPQVWSLIRSGDYDVVISPGYRGLTFWIALLAARTKRIPFAWSSEADRFSGPHTPNWLRRIKQIVIPRIYGLADMVLATSTRAERFARSLRMRRPTIHLTPYAVDNSYFSEHVAAVDRAAIRSTWGVGEDAFVVATCAKFIPKKRTVDVIEAAARIPNLHVVLAGDGELRGDLEGRARSLGIDDRVHFLGFADQVAMAGVYAGADVLVVASDFEPFGMVVGEAMAGGRAAIVSDQVGCIDDLVHDGHTGWTFPVGDIDAMVDRITQAMVPGVAAAMGERAQERMKTWTVSDHVDAVVEACQAALARRRH